MDAGWLLTVAIIPLTVDGGLGLGGSCGNREGMDFKSISEAKETRLSV